MLEQQTNEISYSDLMNKHFLKNFTLIDASKKSELSYHKLSVESSNGQNQLILKNEKIDALSIKIEDQTIKCNIPVNYQKLNPNVDIHAIAINQIINEYGNSMINSVIKKFQPINSLNVKISTSKNWLYDFFGYRIDDHYFTSRNGYEILELILVNITKLQNHSRKRNNAIVIVPPMIMSEYLIDKINFTSSTSIDNAASLVYVGSAKEHNSIFYKDWQYWSSQNQEIKIMLQNIDNVLSEDSVVCIHKKDFDIITIHEPDNSKNVILKTKSYIGRFDEKPIDIRTINIIMKKKPIIRKIIDYLF